MRSTSETLELGPIKFVALRSDLEPAVKPRVDIVIGPHTDPITISTTQWEELKDAARDIKNFVPITLLLTTLIDRGDLTIERLKDAAKDIPPGLMHFRPNIPHTKAAAREVVGQLLGMEGE